MALARPTQQSVPFASSGVKNAIPETATGSNLASLQEGFPTITMTDVDNGGMPPQGQDMNGILFDVTTAIRYQQAGGLFPYDATFASVIDGYPLGAILTATDGSCLYQNTVSGNQTDPENGGTGWSQILSSASIAGKQDALSPVQMDAVNSGITAARVAIYDGYAAGKQDTLTFDNAPTSGSTNPVTSDGIYAALGTKQDTITVDATPQSGSTNPVQSGGVYNALAGKVDIADADDAEVTATGSTTQRTLADWMKDVSGNHRADKPLVLVVAGQSNAAGRGAVASNYSLPSGKWWNGTAWVSGISDYVKSPIDSTWSSSAKGSMIPALAKTIHEKTGRNVYIIPLGVGGANCAQNKVSSSGTWASNGTLRASALTQYENAINALSEAYEVLGTVWLQGETDATWIANGSETLADYTSSVTDTASWFVENVGGHFFIIPIAHSITSGDNTEAQAVNAVLASLAQSNQQASIVTTVTTTLYGRGLANIHYTQSGYDETGVSAGQGISAFIPCNIVQRNNTYRKRILFYRDQTFDDTSAAMTALGTLLSASITSLYPQAVALNDGFLYVLFWGYSGTSSVGGAVVVAVFDFSTGDYVRYHILDGASKTESLVVKTEGTDVAAYIVDSSSYISRFVLDTNNGSVLTGTQESVQSGLFFSYRNGYWLVLNPDNMVSGVNPGAWTIYDDSWNFVQQLRWTLYDYDMSLRTTAPDNVRRSIPHLQGVALGDDGIFLFKGGSSETDSTGMTAVSAIGVDMLDFYGNLRQSSICVSSELRSKIGVLLGGTVNRSENEAGFVLDDGTVCSLERFLVDGAGKILVTEQFSSHPEAIDFSDCAFARSNVPYLCNTPLLPKPYINPWTGESLTSLDDVIVMMARYGMDNLRLAPYNNGWTTVNGVQVIGTNSNVDFELTRITGSSMSLRVGSISNDENRECATYLISVDASAGTVGSPTLLSGRFSHIKLTDSLNVETASQFNATVNLTSTGKTYLANRLHYKSNTVYQDFGGDSSYQYVNQLRFYYVDPSTNAKGAYWMTPAAFSSSVGANLGSANFKWGDIFSSNGTIQTSDYRLKDNISDISDEVLDAWGLVNLQVFQFKDALEKKGASARLHMGVIAQQVQRAFEAKGLDAFRFGLLCYDSWEDEYEDVDVVDQEAVLDEDGNEVTPAVTHTEQRQVQEAGDRYSIRYEEALVLEAAYQRRRADRIEARLEALEERMA